LRATSTNCARATRACATASTSRAGTATRFPRGPREGIIASAAADADAGLAKNRETTSARDDDAGEAPGGEAPAMRSGPTPRARGAAREGDAASSFAARTKPSASTAASPPEDASSVVIDARDAVPPAPERAREQGTAACARRRRNYENARVAREDSWRR
jgi:hypothetical protein